MRIPIYFAIDCGENMHSLLATKVREAISTLLQSSRMNPVALERMWMSIVSVGSSIEVVRTLCPLEEIRDIKVRPTNNRINTIDFEKQMVKLFSKELINRRTLTDKPDFRPRIFWLSDGSHHELVKRCSNPYHWERSGCLSWFSEVNCCTDDFSLVLGNQSFWICNQYDDELLPDEEELVEMLPKLYLPPYYPKAG